jgi:hypothetical protein
VLTGEFVKPAAQRSTDRVVESLAVGIIKSSAFRSMPRADHFATLTPERAGMFAVMIRDFAARHREAG